MKLVIKENRELLKIKINMDNNNIFIFKNLYNKLAKEKNKIDNIYNYNIDKWDKYKKICNPYELLNSTNKIKIVKHKPISRSFFKIIEIINDFKIININNQKELNIGFIAEGPGGFMEALLYIRKNKKDSLYGTTLYPSNQKIPNWDQFREYRRNNLIIKNNVYTSYNNLYNYNDIIEFVSNFNNNKADFVTADGGFDYSQDYNGQERMSCRIILCEIICMCKILKENGHFVCKIFDIFTKFSCKLIYLLSCIFKEVYIIKPVTSRVANSEKYIVCKYFKNIDQNYLNNLISIIKNWNDNISDIFEDNLPDSFIQNLYNYNSNYINKQITSINTVINFMNNNNITINECNIIKKKQIINAINWCKKYNIEYFDKLKIKN